MLSFINIPDILLSMQKELIIITKCFLLQYECKWVGRHAVHRNQCSHRVIPQSYSDIYWFFLSWNEQVCIHFYCETIFMRNSKTVLTLQCSSIERAWIRASKGCQVLCDRHRHAVPLHRSPSNVHCHAHQEPLCCSLYRQQRNAKSCCSFSLSFGHYHGT